MMPKFLHLLILVFLAFRLEATEGNYKIDCMFPGCDGDDKFFLLTLFLPYNPTILAYTEDPQVNATCHNWWPGGCVFFNKEPLQTGCDLLWIDRAGRELETLQAACDIVGQASAIFTTTQLSNQGDSYEGVKQFLENSGFVLLGHWYFENQNGQAMFLKKNLLNAALKSLNYTPCNFYVESSAAENNIERFFKKVCNKSPIHRIGEIDFIYMINLDERPEKFALASTELALYGIYPYRFSAVNGWTLSTEAINQVGVKFTSDFGQEQFLGSIYRKIEDREYLGVELLRPNGESFFSLGMSRGAIGIVLSHLSVLQDAFDSGYQTVWIMEDDVEAVDNPMKIQECIRELDRSICDWDILFTDTDTKDRNGNHVPCRAIAARPNVNIAPLTSFFERFYPISSELSRTGMRYGAYSMIVRRSGMAKILNYFKSYGIFLPYDMDIWLNPSLKMYCVNKNIVSHRAGAPTDNNKPHYLKQEKK